ncbi:MULTISPECIES: hypothetical protein [unclassified Pseudoalteromonas]|uniref:hypothetical protein n=1 Tax=unclassified Pseudoalteromonas TaxID=194690 RepID=UPI0006CA49A8|nr:MULTISPECIES: hypothetical protein [unclassified Pseudoalteromonas]KPM77842.1 hypothetical protein AOG26_08245 [Pseudoalteromonas sp. UCD-33C]KPZ68556.1 hypothetical protein AN394_03088 [Pseudoalteromonas sp. P1-26]URQ87412.1 hypothetical protein J8Z28_05875 [Pseudoalteromonas sp. SCSIO 43088]
MSGKKLYTFLMDWNGGTFISQSRGDNIQEATKGWLNQLSIEEIKTSERSLSLFKSSLQDDLQPIAIEGNTSVWCLSEFISGELAIINIIATLEK